MKFKLYSSIMFFIMVLILVNIMRQPQIERFGFWDFDWVPLPPPLPFGEVANIINRIGNFSRQITNLPVTIANSAKVAAEDVLDVALIPPRSIVSLLKGSITQLEGDFKKLFDILPKLFDKLKYFTELLMISVNRARVCSEGAERVLKTYTLKTKDILAKLSNIHKKIKICPTNPLRQPTAYYRDCVSQIIPLIKGCYTYTHLLIKLYQEFLTYDELFPQNIRDKEYCRTHHSNVRTKKETIEYANRCNYCLHLKSILKLGLGELKEFAKLITNISNGGAKLEKAMGKLIIKI